MKLLKFISITLIFGILSSFVTFCITNVLLAGKPANKKEKAEDLYSSALILSQIYNSCSHTISVPAGTISYSSSEELLKRFPGYEITSGDEERIVLSTQIDDFCPYHYKASLRENEINITRLTDNEQITSIKIISDSLSEEEKSLLEQGLTLNSQKALSSFIEDFTS